jgi:predicted NBD/HSP70 family sugar kinase
MLRVDLIDSPVASSGTARQMNRRVILNLIRDKQPISRADLARLSGMQRSTVSLIIEELIHDRWVVEGTTGRLLRGRHPTLLHLNQRRRILCVDIRPQRTYIGISDINGVFGFQESISTDPDPNRAIRQILDRLRPLLKTSSEESFDGIGISLPGRIDDASQKLIFAPNLKWAPVDIKTPIERATGLDVALENAASACALAEIWFNRTSSIRNLVAVTVSEGIGTGIVADGHLVRGASGMAGEFGHFLLDPGGPLCGCGKHGCWEMLASDRAAVRYYFESSARSSKRRQSSLDLKDLLWMAEQGDILAVKAIDKMATQLARGIGMIAAGLDPEAILFIGDFTAAWSRFQPHIEAAVKMHKTLRPPIKILPARDGELTRLRGSVALVLDKHFGLSLPVSTKAKS